MSDVAEAFEIGGGMTVDWTLPLGFNIAPTQTVVAVRADKEGQRELCRLRWGLVPHWADDPQIGSRLINARAESVATKPAYRDAFKSRRCLVAADGFYEWQKSGRRKQPYYIRLKDDGPFGFAALWERWSHAGQRIESCSIITTEANELMAGIHDRMPVIVPREAYELWLSADTQEIELLQSLLRPYPASEMTAYPVSNRVNSPACNDPQCIQPQSAAAPTLFD
jgi:putative SOS response-associated peptidase YedK